MGVIGFVALVANFIVTTLLYRYRQSDSQALSVWLCTRRDVLVNVAVIAAGAGVGNCVQRRTYLVAMRRKSFEPSKHAFDGAAMRPRASAADERRTDAKRASGSVIVVGHRYCMDLDPVDGVRHAWIARRPQLNEISLSNGKTRLARDVPGSEIGQLIWS
jgi:hypothetical protein